MAVIDGHVATVALLLDRGADVDAVNMVRCSCVSGHGYTLPFYFFSSCLYSSRALIGWTNGLDVRRSQR